MKKCDNSPVPSPIANVLAQDPDLSSQWNLTPEAFIAPVAKSLGISGKYAIVWLTIPCNPDSVARVWSIVQGSIIRISRADLVDGLICIDIVVRYFAGKYRPERIFRLSVKPNAMAKVSELTAQDIIQSPRPVNGAICSWYRVPIHP